MRYTLNNSISFFFSYFGEIHGKYFVVSITTESPIIIFPGMEDKWLRLPFEHSQDLLWNTLLKNLTFIY